MARCVFLRLPRSLLKIGSLTNLFVGLVIHSRGHSNHSLAGASGSTYENVKVRRIPFRAVREAYVWKGCGQRPDQTKKVHVPFCP